MVHSETTTLFGTSKVRFPMIFYNGANAYCRWELMVRWRFALFNMLM